MSESAAFSDLGIGTGFKPSSERLIGEREERLENVSGVIPFGISFLDDALSGIFRNDLILIGSKTGAGKTQLASIIAMNAARMGKRVHFMALEAESREIERRMYYQNIVSQYYALKARPPIKFSYIDWYMGKLDDEIERLKNEWGLPDVTLPTLNTFYRTQDFTAQDFQRIFFAIKDETDLVIVDHLHYFDMETENENRELKQIVKAIRDCALISNKPIVLIAHVRKTDRGSKSICPTIEDFHGSSDVGKIATKAIMIAPDYSAPATERFPTFFRILKCRLDGSRSRYAAASGFSVTKQSYEKDYLLGRFNFDSSDFLGISNSEIPDWAVSAKRS